jgi:hypothetical protein
MTDLATGSRFWASKQAFDLAARTNKAHTVYRHRLSDVHIAIDAAAAPPTPSEWEPIARYSFS